MKRSRLNRPRLIIGFILVFLAALILLFGKGVYATAGMLAIALLGLVSIAISNSRPRKP